MSDNFYNKDDSGGTANPAGTATESIKIGENEYTPDELINLEKDAEFKRDVEKKQNTDLSKVFGEYTKLTQDKKNWEDDKQELETFRQEKEDATKPLPVFDEETKAKAVKEARELGLFTKEDVEKLLDEKFPGEYNKQRNADKMLESMELLEKEIDGEDGRPKFVLGDVLEYIKETGIKNPLQAYKLKHEAELDTWKEKKLTGAKREGIFSDTGSSAGGKQPEEIRPTRDNVGKLVKEVLNENN